MEKKTKKKETCTHTHTRKPVCKLHHRVTYSLCVPRRYIAPISMERRWKQRNNNKIGSHMQNAGEQPRPISNFSVELCNSNSTLKYVAVSSVRALARALIRSWFRMARFSAVINLSMRRWYRAIHTHTFQSRIDNSIGRAQKHKQYYCQSVCVPLSMCKCVCAFECFFCLYLCLYLKSKQQVDDTLR